MVFFSSFFFINFRIFDFYIQFYRPVGINLILSTILGNGYQTTGKYCKSLLFPCFDVAYMQNITSPTRIPHSSTLCLGIREKLEKNNLSNIQISIILFTQKHIFFILYTSFCCVQYSMITYKYFYKLLMRYINKSRKFLYIMILKRY